MYIEEDKSTHANYTDFSQAFKKDLDFFKGMANLFCAYACHPNIFPVYAGFNEEKGKTERLIKEEKHSSFNKVKDTNKRAKSVKSLKYYGNPGILSNYLSGEISDLSKSNSKRIKSKIQSCKAS